jgi:hypothetical protein
LLKEPLVGGRRVHSRTGGHPDINKRSCVLLLISASEFYSCRSGLEDAALRLLAFVFHVEDCCAEGTYHGLHILNIYHDFVLLLSGPFLVV